MVNENYSSFTRTRPNKGIYQPAEPKITEKREKREREQEREKKKDWKQSLDFIVRTLEIDFLNDKKDQENPGTLP